MYAVPSTVGRMVTEPDAEVRRFCELFPAAYLAFHRRDGKRDQLSGASRAVLLHLAQTGPLTVGEAAVHLDRAQSVVSRAASSGSRRGLSCSANVTTKPAITSVGPRRKRVPRA